MSSVGVAERLKRKAVQKLAVDDSLGKASSSKLAKRTEPDLFELPPLPEGAADNDNDDDDYYELPIHRVLYSSDIDISQVSVALPTLKLVEP